jgi:predicted ArsR family transcriptional regulator
MNPHSDDLEAQIVTRLSGSGVSAAYVGEKLGISATAARKWLVAHGAIRSSNADPVMWWKPSIARKNEADRRLARPSVAR